MKLPFLQNQQDKLNNHCKNELLRYVKIHSHSLMRKNNTDTNCEKAFVFRPLWHLCVLMFEIETSWYITFFNATPCLKPDETGFMLDCWKVPFLNIWLCSIVWVFDFRSSIDKNFWEFDYQAQSKSMEQWSSIVFDYETFN